MQAGEHVHCLDLLQVASEPGTPKAFCDCAILLEIWDFGGLLQANLPIPEKTVISIPSIGRGISAKVVSCQQDEFGYMVEISVRDPAWFPAGYIPQYVLAPPN
jgi:hypothetical protein